MNKHNPTPEQLAALEPKQRELVEQAMQVGAADRRNSIAFVQQTIARTAWLRAARAESERRRKEYLANSPSRATRETRAALKRRRRAAR